MDIIDYSRDQRKICEDAEDVDWYGEVETKPGIEQDLFNLQKVYYDKNSTDKQRQDAWLGMMDLTHQYTRSLVKQKLKHKKYLTPDIIEDYANLATVNFMSQYVYRPNFKCGASFGKMIGYKVLEALYGKKDEEKVQSLSVSLLDKDTDLLSMQERINIKFLFGRSEEDEKDIYSNEEVNREREIIHELLDDFDDIVTDQAIRLKARMYFQLVIRHPKNRHVKEQFIKYICKNKKEIDAVQILELELYKRFKRSVIQYSDEEIARHKEWLKEEKKREEKEKKKKEYY